MNEEKRLDDELRRLKPEDPADPQLEERVVAALRGHGLVGSRSAFARIAVAAAAMLVCFSLGWFSRPLVPAPPESGVRDRASFLLLLGGDVDPAPITASELRNRIEAHRGWAVSLRSDGRLVASEKLAGAGEWLEQPEAVPVPRAALGGERLLGFYLIRAAGMAEAIELSRSCPILEHGGSVTVYPIDPT